MVLPRLRQVALAAGDLDAVVGELRSSLPLGEPFHDPGVAHFGLANAVFCLGDTFLEVVSPRQGDTAAGRYLRRRGGDSGYMAIFQVDDLEHGRHRLDSAGIRVVWSVDEPDAATMHLHPADMGGAIVSLDRMQPPESWRWAGPTWTGGAPRTAPGGIAELVVEVPAPTATARRWATAVGLEASALASTGSGAQLTLPSGQRVRFETGPADGPGGITGLVVALPAPAGGRPPERHLTVAGVQIVLR